MAWTPAPRATCRTAWLPTQDASLEDAFLHITAQPDTANSNATEVAA